MALVAVVALAVSACTTAPETATTLAATSTSALASVTTLVDTSTTAGAEGESGWSIQDHLAWFLAVLNGADVTAEDYEARFAQIFKDQVAFSDFIPVTEQITAGLTGWSVVETETSGSTNLVTLISPSAGEPLFRLLLNIDADRRIDGLFVQPAEPPTLDDPPGTFDEAFDRLAALGTAGVLVAETTDGSCVLIAETLSRMPLPLGSMFKIYVLGAIGEAIAGGSIGWDDSVTLDEAYYSLPSGTTQTEEPGSQLTVRELAQRMIEISDNTATDHLIALVGREAVEAIQAEMGTADPSLNIPFITTRELFQLKLGEGSALDAYIAGDAVDRRQILADLADEPLPDLTAVVEFTDPVAVLSAEWFASPLDLCEAWAYLASRAGEAGLQPIGDIAGANPGIPDETDTWDEIWFKGGSEPGVLGTSWYLTTGDRSFVVAGSVFNETVAFEQTEAILLFGAIRDLLAAEVSG